ncbi:molybdopterin-dependent oxidoreductase [Intrasporangium sp.]|uniref:molybdopterin-dependent oxidoreductase n=1 Tax=Intrasporangium sp. TaxID=1925024 RepID=UPI003365840B
MNEFDFPAWLRVTHLLNFFLIGLLLRSGWQIIATHPRFYWRNDCGPGTEWIKFTKRVVPPEEGAYTAHDDELEPPSWLTLPGGRNPGLGRHWHGLATVLWILNGLVYVSLLFLTGEWRRIVPTSWSIFPEAWESLKIYVGFGIPSIEHFTPYDALQQLGYFTVVFIAAPLMIATGPTMSPAFIGRFPWYPKLFGGRQAARSIHFLGMAFLSLFIVVHVALVFITHREYNVTHMVFGEYDPARVAQATTIIISTIVLVVVAWLAISYLSIRDRRGSQKFLYGALEPFRRVTLNRLKPRMHRASVYTEKDISPYHWTNGRYPAPDESPEWHELAAHDFRDYELEIGPADNPVRVPFDRLKALPQQEQIVLHACMQGWTGVAKWKGPRVMDVMNLVGPPPADAKFLVVTSFGLAQSMSDGRPLEPFYSVIPIEDCREEDSIFAWMMNDKPLPWTFGAPLRLRVESYVGYKMVKYIRSLEWVTDYSTIGDGMGGTREDSGYQVINARI